MSEFLRLGGSAPSFPDPEVTGTPVFILWMVFVTGKALCTKGGGMLTLQCTDVSQNMCAYLKHYRSERCQESKFSSYISSITVFLILFENCLWRVMEVETKIQAKGSASHVLEVEEDFVSLWVTVWHGSYFIQIIACLLLQVLLELHLNLLYFILLPSSEAGLVI